MTNCNEIAQDSAESTMRCPHVDIPVTNLGSIACSLRDDGVKFWSSSFANFVVDYLDRVFSDDTTINRHHVKFDSTSITLMFPRFDQFDLTASSLEIYDSDDDTAVVWIRFDQQFISADQLASISALVNEIKRYDDDPLQFPYQCTNCMFFCSEDDQHLKTYTIEVHFGK